MLERPVLAPTLSPRWSGASTALGFVVGLVKLLVLPITEEPARRDTAAACCKSVSMRMRRSCTLDGVHNALANLLAPSRLAIGGRFA